jgi:hypothetical protein
VTTRQDDNAGVSQIDRAIDGLYQLPPGEFTAARTTLAKTLTGDAARQVRALKKPTAVPWAVNQVYWKARSAYDTAMKAGHALRQAQIAMLRGKKADVRAATDAHRRAISAAVHHAAQLASKAGLNPDADQLARMFEAVSLAAAPPPTPGRFTDLVEPSGFDALAGIAPAKRVHVASPAAIEADVEDAAAPSKEDRAAERRRLEQERREAEDQLKAATRELERVRARAQEAREALEQAEADLAHAEREVDVARRRVNQGHR